MLKFITGRTKAIYYSIKGAFHLVKTEHSIQAQLFISLFFVLAGFYFNLSNIEWLFVVLAISLVLTAESLNSAIEKVADFKRYCCRCCFFCISFCFCSNLRNIHS